MDVRVLTFNVLSPEHEGWPRRRAVIRDGIAALRPDLVALQEVVDPADLLDERYTVVAHSRPSADGVGAVLASRWPVRWSRELDLRLTERVTLPWSAVVAAAVDAPPPLGPLLFVHHKPTYEYGYAPEREAQAVAAARFVEALGFAGHVVLAGDFDDTPTSAAVRFWTGAQALDGFGVCYEDAWRARHGDAPGHTFTPRNPLVPRGEMALERGRRIDYVLVRCGVHGPTLEVADCRLVFDEPVDGVWASDHFGLLADLVVPERAPGPTGPRP
jgi:endonuclease/exonuclease/phosphatase family metal-dependent hydrolase